MNFKNLKNLLNVYWLRPETALWRAIDIEIMKDFKIIGKSLDLGCGDGVLSFIRANGEFDILFDDYQSVGNLDTFFKNSDVHDFFKDDYSPVVAKRPDYKISVALDHKHNLLSKASKLDFYSEFITHDANNPLPFKDNTFDTVFSNIVYWLDDPNSAISEISRIVKQYGKIALMLPNSSMPEFSFYRNFYANGNMGGV